MTKTQQAQRELAHDLDYLKEWAMSLTIEEIENEEFTLRHEFHTLGMSKDEAVDRQNALDVAKGIKFS